MECNGSKAASFPSAMLDLDEWGLPTCWFFLAGTGALWELQAVHGQEATGCLPG
mgnify:CR=1 FL=1